MTGLRRPSKGRIMLIGKDVTGLDTGDQDRALPTFLPTD